MKTLLLISLSFFVFVSCTKEDEWMNPMYSETGIIDAPIDHLPRICSPMLPVQLYVAEAFQDTGFHWSTGDTAKTITVNTAGSYSVTLNKPGGPVIYQTIIEHCEKELYIPEVFTPGQDGLNDTFWAVFPTGQGIMNYKMKIYNKEGVNLFTTDQPGDGWNGRDKNNNIYPRGIYFYYIKCRYRNKEEAKFKGSVQLIPSW